MRKAAAAKKPREKSAFIMLMLTVAPSDVVLGSLVARLEENIPGLADFHKFPYEKESGVVGDACGLLHGVRHDDDGVFPFQIADQVFDFARRDGVERGRGLV